MRTQSTTEALIRRLYQDVGHPADLVQIRPIDGGWENALSYDITHRDGRKIRILRRFFDDDGGQEHEIKRLLRALT